MDIELRFANPECQDKMPVGMGDLLFKVMVESGASKLYHEQASLQLRLSSRSHGRCHRRGKVFPKEWKHGFLRVVAQPGDNSTCWEVLVPIPGDLSEELNTRLEDYRLSQDVGSSQWWEMVKEELKEDLQTLDCDIARIQMVLASAPRPNLV